MEWKARCIASTHGTQLGAILKAALYPNVQRRTPPYFMGKATITSDGYVMCSFMDRHGRGHMSAFVGSFSDLDENVTGLAAHLDLSAADHNALTAAVAAWIATDYRP